MRGPYGTEKDAADTASIGRRSSELRIFSTRRDACADSVEHAEQELLFANDAAHDAERNLDDFQEGDCFKLN